MSLPPPLGMLCELTHRCPMSCVYCSNPGELVRGAGELDTQSWQRVLEEAAALGVLHVHLSGGEPCARADLEQIVGQACASGLYTNLITSGLLLDAPRLERLCEAGLDHIQLSIQAASAQMAARIGGRKGAHERKLEVAQLVGQIGLPLTINAVVHRQNLSELESIIALAVELGAQRLEVAHAQYVGWALVNRAALMPTRAQLDEATEVVERARERLLGRLVIDYVVSDYHGVRPKACMGGWGRRFINVSPDGFVLPCHAAQLIDGLRFDNVQARALGEIWSEGEAFCAFRGFDWMAEPCRSCPRKEIDFGGCRCQAFLLTGDARNPDPVCELSAHHSLLAGHTCGLAIDAAPELVYRHYSRTP
ncbi:MAG: pyrroloquinoline quinone biosynthesis protein PqqE [Bradymonadaceae bacterium]|nr:pyrroloquinoline quinone biosynthesis protein PqqE [Lujinxingiaceae bacterium]